MKVLTLNIPFEDDVEFDAFCATINSEAKQNQMSREEFAKLLLINALFEDDSDDYCTS